MKTEVRHHPNVNKAFGAVHLSQEGWHERGFPWAHSSHYCYQPTWVNVKGHTEKHTQSKYAQYCIKSVKDKYNVLQPYSIISKCVILCLTQQTYFFNRGSASLSQAKEPSRTLTVESNRWKQMHREDRWTAHVPTNWQISLAAQQRNRHECWWWTYWNWGHAAQCHFQDLHLPETSPGAS